MGSILSSMGMRWGSRIFNVIGGSPIIIIYFFRKLLEQLDLLDGWYKNRVR